MFGVVDYCFVGFQHARRGSHSRPALKGGRGKVDRGGGHGERVAGREFPKGRLQHPGYRINASTFILSNLSQLAFIFYTTKTV